MQDETTPRLVVRAMAGADGLRVAVSGELDIAEADGLLSIVLKDLPDESNLVLDFAGVTFCDSAGLRILVQLREHQTDSGGTFQLINTTTPVRRVIETSGLAEYL